MCTTIGFKYNDGVVFGRTLEISVKLDNKIMFVPKCSDDFIKTSDGFIGAKYATLG